MKKIYIVILSVFFNNVYLFNYFKSIYVILSIGRLRIVYFINYEKKILKRFYF